MTDKNLCKSCHILTRQLVVTSLSFNNVDESDIKILFQEWDSVIHVIKEKSDDFAHVHFETDAQASKYFYSPDHTTLNGKKICVMPIFEDGERLCDLPLFKDDKPVISLAKPSEPQEESQQEPQEESYLQTTMRRKLAYFDEILEAYKKKKEVLEKARAFFDPVKKNSELQFS